MGYWGGWSYPHELVGTLIGLWLLGGAARQCPRVKREHWKEMKSERVHCALCKLVCLWDVKISVQDSNWFYGPYPFFRNPGGIEHIEPWKLQGHQAVTQEPGARSIQCTTPTACDAVFGDLEMYHSSGGRKCCREAGGTGPATRRSLSGLSAKSGEKHRKSTGKNMSG